MIAKRLAGLLLPLALAATLGACDQNQGVNQGYVQQSPQGYRGESGRVVSIREVPIKNGGSGLNNGTLVGGGVGAAGGAIVGGAVSNSVGGALLGAVLGGVGGGIAGTAIDQNSTKRGIEVTIQRDDGQTVTIAQPDNGDVQMGDRVVIVYNDKGVAHAIRDTSQRRD